MLCLSSFALLGDLVTGPASAKRFDILVNADADEGYLQRVQGFDYQTYHFVRGRFFSGDIVDKGLDTAEFEDLAESLSVVLRKRDFYPEPDKGKGDLLIMVSWGRTRLDPDLRDLMGIQNEGEISGFSGQDVPSGDPQGAGPLDMGNGSGGFDGGDFTNSRVRNAVLLGLDDGTKNNFKRMFGTDELRDVLEEERYFVILNAFDYQHLLNEKELKQVWTVRYNTRAVGIGFRDAFDSMNDAVAGVIGLQLDKASTVKGDTKGSVSMGELEVIGLGTEDSEKSDTTE